MNDGSWMPLLETSVSAALVDEPTGIVARNAVPSLCANARHAAHTLESVRPTIQAMPTFGFNWRKA